MIVILYENYKYKYHIIFHQILFYSKFEKCQMKKMEIMTFKMQY